ncbi:MAG: hypothetical protein R2712_10205 [Vicinamibacterales bacterium]
MAAVAGEATDAETSPGLVLHPVLGFIRRPGQSVAEAVAARASTP